MISSLQATRAFAALAVLFFHVNLIMTQKEYGANDVFGIYSELGKLGVDIFFIVSGFIIFMAHEKDIGETNNALTYVKKRFIRIYPIYWVFTLMFLTAAFFGLGYPDFDIDLISTVKWITLFDFGDRVGSPLKVAWTLFFEIRFYLFFLILILHKRLGLLIGGVWGISILIANLSDSEIRNSILDMRNLEFFFGILVFLALRKIKAFSLIYPLLISGLIIFVSWAIVRTEFKDFIPLFRFWDTLIIAFSLSLILLTILSLEKYKGLKVPSIFESLGNATYSIYLVHSAAISACLIIFTKLNLITLLGPGFIFLIVFFAASIAGYLAYLLIEKPLLSSLKKISFSSK